MTKIIIIILLIFLAIAIYNMYKLNKARIEWRNRLGYLITCVLRERIPDKDKLKELENLNKPLKEIQDEGNKENPRKQP